MMLGAAGLVAAVLAVAVPQSETEPALQPRSASSTSQSSYVGNKVRWIHVPKTASTVANTIYRYGCSGIDNSTTVQDVAPIIEFTGPYDPQEYCAGGPLLDIDLLNDHSPWQHPSANALVTMLREPEAQKLSLLDYMIEMTRFVGTPVGFLETDFDIYTPGHFTDADNASLAVIEKSSQVVAAVDWFEDSIGEDVETAMCTLLEELLPRLSGCSSKMTVFSEGCLSTPAIQSSTARAKIVNETAPSLYAFSLVLERYNESICAFNTLMNPKMTVYGDGSQPIAAQFAPGRSGEDSGIDWQGQAERCGGATMRALIEEDPADEAMYAVANAVFEAQLDEIRLEGGATLANYLECAATNSE